MTPRFPSPEFDDAVAAVCHGVATEVEARALNELLRTNPGARDEYLLRVELHTRLASSRDLFTQEDRGARGGRLPPQTLSFGPGESPPLTTVPSRRRRAAPALALGACVALAGAAVLWSIVFKRQAAANDATSDAVAMLTSSVDARWAGAGSPPRGGAALEPGLLRLESGLAQVVFYSGARVVIEGPAVLRLVSRNEAECEMGRLLAEAPPPARGFRIKTGRVEVVDLGTEFGVEATGDRTEIHVFKGRVLVRGGTGASQPLSQGQAAVAKSIGPLRLVAADTTGFSPLFGFQKRSLASETINFDQWRLSSSKLDQDPSILAHLDFENLKGANWTLRDTAEKNQLGQGATIVGCQRADGRWREKPALEFQSVNDRVLLAVPGKWQSLTLSAWVCVKGLDRQINSLFMSDGFEPGTVHWVIRHDGVLGLTVIGSGPEDCQIVPSPRVLTMDKLGVWLHLAVVLDGAGRRVAHYFNGSLVSDKRLRIHPPFRVGPAEIGNWNVGGFQDQDRLLIRNFSGAMDEFCLFGRALGANEIRALYAEGKPQARP